MSSTDPSSAPAAAVFVLVGHCGADAYSLTRAVHRAAPGSAVVVANSDAELARLGTDAVLLINRVLDGGFAAESGVELIQTLARREPKPVMVLISNYEDAQDAAVAAGALRGFGKSELGSAATTQTVRALAAM